MQMTKIGRNNVIVCKQVSYLLYIVSKEFIEYICFFINLVIRCACEMLFCEIIYIFIVKN